MVAIVLIAIIINIGADIERWLPPQILLYRYIFSMDIIVYGKFFDSRNFTSDRVYAQTFEMAGAFITCLSVNHSIIDMPWARSVIMATLFLILSLVFAFLFIITGVLGATISPTCFWGSVAGRRTQKKNIFKKWKLQSQKADGKANEDWYQRGDVDFRNYHLGSIMVVAGQCCTKEVYRTLVRPRMQPRRWSHCCSFCRFLANWFAIGIIRLRFPQFGFVGFCCLRCIKKLLTGTQASTWN